MGGGNRGLVMRGELGVQGTSISLDVTSTITWTYSARGIRTRIGGEGGGNMAWIRHWELGHDGSRQVERMRLTNTQIQIQIHRFPPTRSRSGSVS